MLHKPPSSFTWPPLAFFKWIHKNILNEVKIKLNWNVKVMKIFVNNYFGSFNLCLEHGVFLSTNWESSHKGNKIRTNPKICIFILGRKTRGFLFLILRIEKWSSLSWTNTENFPPKIVTLNSLEKKIYISYFFNDPAIRGWVNEAEKIIKFEADAFTSLSSGVSRCASINFNVNILFFIFLEAMIKNN